MSITTPAPVKAARDVGHPILCHKLIDDGARRLCGGAVTGAIPRHYGSVGDGICQGCGFPKCIVCLDLLKSVA